MIPVVIDASALAAIVFNEAEGVRMASQVEGREVHAPSLLRYEIANIAVQKMRRRPDEAARLARAAAEAVGVRGGIIWHDVDAADAVVVAQSTGLSAYDAGYLWLAGSLGADLITLDDQLAAAIEAPHDLQAL